MNKRNLIIQAAVAAVFGVVGLSAQAGIANGVPANLAAQSIASNASIISTGSVAFSTQSPVAASAGAGIPAAYIYVKLSGGAKFAAAAGANLTTATDMIVANSGATAVVTVGTGVVSTDQTFAYFPITVTGAALPINTTMTYRAATAATADASVTNAGFLLTPGTFLDATISIGSTASSTTVQADVDTAATGHAAQSVNGVTFTAVQSGASTFTTASNGVVGTAVETKKIDVVGGAGTAFAATTAANSNTGVSTTLLNFGGFSFTNVPGVLSALTGAPFTIATNYASVLSAVLTGNFGAAAGTGGKVFLTSDNACGTPTAAGSLGVLSATNTVATFTGVTAPVTATPYYVCMQINNPSNAIAIPATAPSLVVTLPGTAATTATITTPAATLYSLNTNGASTKVKSYIPAGVAGYTTYIRVINTGSVTANVSAAVVSDTTGVAGTPAVIAPSVPAGGAVTLSSAQIETAIGAVTPTSRPTLLVTAPSTIVVQSFILTNANGNFSDVSSGE